MTRVRWHRWLAGLLAGLFALGMVAAPLRHAQSLIERAVFAVAYAMPDGTLPEICSGSGDGREGGDGPHAFMPACAACVLVAAPGLPPPASATPARLGPALAAGRCLEPAAADAQPTRAPQRARAPPPPSIA